MQPLGPLEEKYSRSSGDCIGELCHVCAKKVLSRRRRRRSEVLEQR
jgi:hypothetical protein